MKISVTGEFWPGGKNPEKADFEIEKTDDGITVNGQSATMNFNTVELEFVVGEDIFCLTASRSTGSSLSIDSIHELLA